jgi:uncharacterized membrane protein
LLQALISLVVAGIAAPDLLRLVASSTSRTPAILQAAIYLTLETGVTLLAGYLAFWVIKPRPNVSVWPFLRRVTLAAVWFAPATLLAKISPWWAIAGAVSIAIVTARCLRGFQEAESTDLLRRNRLISGFFAALALQGGIVASTAGQRSLAVSLVATGCFLIAWQPAWRIAQQTRTNIFRQLLLALTILFFGFVLTHSTRGFGPPPAPIAKISSPTNRLKGVILLTEPKPRAKLLSPALTYAANPRIQPTRRPTSIPFSGEYWIFPSLFRLAGGKAVAVNQRPPPTSLVKRGDPINSTFSSTVRWLPLVMKAHQSMETPVDLAGYQHIDIAVIIPDIPSGLVSIELILLSSASGHTLSHSLGQVPVQTQSGDTKLRYNVPAALDSFDAIEVLFNLETRRDKSAKIAIDRFDFVPPGL